MTHPDIIKTERFGSLYPNYKPETVGSCLFCGEDVYDDMPDSVKSRDGVFCDTECCRRYYDIRVM